AGAPGSRSTCQYAGDGKRVRKDDSGGTVKPARDSENVLLDPNHNHLPQLIYTLEPMLYGNLLSQRRGGATQYYQFDGVGSVDGLTDSSGVVTDSYLYRAFGSIQFSSGTSVNPYNYVGQAGYYYDQDLAGYYLRARHYD